MSSSESLSSTEKQKKWSVTIISARQMSKFDFFSYHFVYNSNKKRLVSLNFETGTCGFQELHEASQTTLGGSLQQSKLFFNIFGRARRALHVELLDFFNIYTRFKR